MKKKQFRNGILFGLLLVLLTLTGCVFQGESGNIPGEIAQQGSEINTVGTATEKEEERPPLGEASCGVMTGTVGEQFLETQYPNSKVQTYNTIPDAIMAVASGKVDYVLTAYTTALNAVRTNPQLEIAGEDITQDSIGIAMAKERTDLQEEIDEILTKFKEDGTLDQVLKRWTTEGADYPAQPFPASTGSKGVLRVAIAADREPMCFVRDGAFDGVDRELMERIATEMDMRVEYQNMQFSGLVAALESGKADLIISNMVITEERKERVHFSQPYFQNPQVLLARKLAQAVPEQDFLGELGKSFQRTFLVEERWKLVLNGLGVTVVLSLSSGVLGLGCAFGLCMLRRSKRRIASVPASVLIRLVQGTPIVVLLMILYYVAFSGVDISAVVVAILGFSLYFSAYASEMMRTGIAAVDKGQTEASMALGFGKGRTFWKVVFPQAARHFLPLLKGEFISLVKMTSVVGYIAVQDLTKVSDIIRSRTLEAFFPLIATAVIYFVVANVMAAVLSRLELKVAPKRKDRSIRGVKMR